MVTTGFYLKLNGISTPMAELKDFDFIQMIKDRPELIEFLDALVKKALHGI